eukprot:12902459-Prorocentrum_lima.AAC.1
MAGTKIILVKKKEEAFAPRVEEEPPDPVAGSTMQILILKGETESPPTLPATFKPSQKTKKVDKQPRLE